MDLKGTKAMYDRDYADIYDQIHLETGKDYAAEAAAIAELIRARNPGARSLLDVACGSGEHLRHLRKVFDHVEGVDLSEPMRAFAAERLPGVAIHAGDMRTFALGDVFDAVVCLYFSIEYMRDLDELSAAVDRMAAHLAPGGVLLVDTSGDPDPDDVGGIDHLVFERDGRTVIQMIHSRPVSDRLSLTDMYSMVGDDSGVRTWKEIHEMGLFALDEYRDAFTRAGLDAVEVVRLPRNPHRVIGVKP